MNNDINIDNEVNERDSMGSDNDIYNIDSEVDDSESDGKPPANTTSTAHMRFFKIMTRKTIHAKTASETTIQNNGNDIEIDVDGSEEDNTKTAASGRDSIGSDSDRYNIASEVDDSESDRKPPANTASTAPMRFFKIIARKTIHTKTASETTIEDNGKDIEIDVEGSEGDNTYFGGNE
jgi:hypothetical protein